MRTVKSRLLPRAFLCRGALIGLCTAFLLAWPHGDVAADEEQVGKYFYYGHGGERVPLTLSTQKIGVRFVDDTPDSNKRAVLKAQAQLGEMKEEAQPTNVKRRGMSLVPVTKTKTSTDVEALLASLAKEPDVAFATPVFQVAPGHDELLTDRFYASFPASTPRQAIEELNAKHGVEVVAVKERPRIGIVGYRLRVTPASELNALEMANLYYEEALTVTADPLFLPLYPLINTTPNDTFYSYQWALPKIDAPDAWDITTGSTDITIAILDTGIDIDHPDLEDKLLRDASDNIIGRNFYADPPNSDVDDGLVPHGTCCAGLAAAETNNSTCIAGVSWGAQIMPVKVCSDYGQFYYADVADGIEWACDNGAHILSMSLSGSTWNSDLAQAVQEARAEGCILVASTGNDSSSTPSWPPGLAEVISVGAADEYDLRWCSSPTRGSNYGSEVDVLASAGSLTTYTTYGGGGYTPVFGMTSAACPQVSGLASLVLSVNPGLTPAQVQAIICFSADDLVYSRTSPIVESAGVGRDVYTGYGRINCESALELASAGRFAINDSSGDHLASFDMEGNLVIEGDYLCQDSVDNSTITSQQLAAELQAVTSQEEFLLYDSSDNLLLRVTGEEDPRWDDDSDGDMDDDEDGVVDDMLYMKGRVYEALNVNLDTVVTSPCFRVKDDSGTTVALVTSSNFTNSTIEPDSPYTVVAGSLLLKGRLFAGANPDNWD